MKFNYNNYSQSAKRFLVIIFGLTIISCHSEKKGNQTSDSVKQVTKTAKTDKVVSENGFDINAIAVSDKALGSFPYVGLPEGYENQYPARVDYEVAYFWVGNHFEKPEGRIFYSRVVSKKNKTYSDIELGRNIAKVITDAGGIKIFEGKLDPDTAYDSIPQQNRLKYTNGYGFIGYKTTSTYLIRRSDRNIWIQFTPGDDGASIGWMVLETKPLKITASIIQADQIKKELDINGHIALYINFETDKSAIEPASLPIVNELTKLLSENSSLRVKIEGHTDNAGSAPYNLKLSNARAAWIKNLLIKAGIREDRLQAAGMGQTKPLADNESEAGKAKNRRVEIIKI